MLLHKRLVAASGSKPKRSEDWIDVALPLDDSKCQNVSARFLRHPEALKAYVKRSVTAPEDGHVTAPVESVEWFKSLSETAAAELRNPALIVQVRPSGI